MLEGSAVWPGHRLSMSFSLPFPLRVSVAPCEAQERTFSHGDQDPLSPKGEGTVFLDGHILETAVDQFFEEFRH